MPRYYRRRYTRVVRPKKKWASNIAVWSNETLSGSSSVVLVSNNIQSGTPTPTIVKVGNFKISADIMLSATSLSGYNPVCVAYVLYVPEGWSATASEFDRLIEAHPEWILGTKTVGGNVVATSANLFSVDSLNMSTRLKRNLNSGDKIYFYLRVNNISVTSATITGTCRYWTCSN